MAAPRLILHIGPHKTATSFVQAAFDASAPTLGRAGVRYCSIGREGVAHHHLARAMYDSHHGGPAGGTSRTLWAAVRDELDSLGPDGRLLVSSEDFSQLLDRDLDALAGELVGVDVELLVGVRHPVAAIPSLWQESVKWARQWSLPTAAQELLRDDRIAVVPLIDRWVRRFPQRAPLLAVVPGTGGPGDVLSNVADALGLRAGTLAEPSGPTSLNRSITLLHAEAVRSVSIALDPCDEPSTLDARQQVTRRLAGLPLAGDDGERPRLTGEVLARADELAATTVERLRASDWRVHGDLDAIGGDARRRDRDDPRSRPTAVPSRQEIVGALEQMQRTLGADERRQRVAIALAITRLQGGAWRDPGLVGVRGGRRGRWRRDALVPGAGRWRRRRRSC